MEQQMEIVQEMGKLNELIVKETRRPDGSLRIQLDFSNCVSKTDQSGIDAGDINKLIKKHSPQELELFLRARNLQRQEIVGHDFSKEPNLQEAKNEIVRLQKVFDSIDPELKKQFGNLKEFITFVDNPQNAEKLVKLGLLSQKQVDEVKLPEKQSAVDESAAKV